MTARKRSPWFLIVELFILFIGLPIVYLFDLPINKLFPLIALFIYCTSVLILNSRANPTWFNLRANWKLILLRFTGVAVLVLVSIKLFTGLPMFTDLSRSRKLTYMLFMYPLLSAFPQELIFREFFFFRYQEIFSKKTTLLIANVVLFSFAHIYFVNWIVIAFTLAGGMLFSLTYLKTKSLLVVTIEHSIYGLLILSSGLTDYFYKAF